MSMSTAITRAVLLLFSVSNFLASHILFEFTKQARESIEEGMPLIFYYGADSILKPAGGG